MFFCKSLHIDQSIRPFLANIGISKFQEFFNYSAGKLVSRASKRPVRVFSLDLSGQQRNYFLKQYGAQSLRAALKAWRRLQVPHSAASHEHLLLELFRDQGIPVMKAVHGRSTGFSAGLSHEVLVKTFDKLDEIVRNVAIEKDVVLIDASAYLSGKAWAFYDHVHLDLAGKGSEALAQFIADRLQDVLRE